MEESSQRDFKSSYKDVSPSLSEQDVDISKKEHIYSATRTNNMPPTEIIRNLSSIKSHSRGPAIQPPGEGQKTSCTQNSNEGTSNNMDFVEIGEGSVSDSSNGLISYFDLELSHEESMLSHSGCCNLETTSRVSSVPLIGEQTSCSSECNSAPFTVQLISDETTSHKGYKARECRSPVLSDAKGGEALRPFITPVLLTGTNLEENGGITDPQPGEAEREIDHIRQQLQKDPPQEIILQPLKATKLTFKSQTQESQIYECNKTTHTPPPSYQESLSYPVIQHQPVPDLATTIGACSNTTRTKDPLISIIRLTSPPLGQPTSAADPSTRDSVFLWHSASSENCNRDSNAQDQYSDHQILALLACIMFWPVGLLAIYYANMANILRSEGVHAKSLIYSKRALLLSLVSFMIGTGVYLTFYLQRQITL